MEYRYRCLDCGCEFPGGGVMYLCPSCSPKRTDGEFTRGLLEVILDLSQLPDPREITPQDFFVYPVPDSPAYPAGGTPLAKPLALSKKYGFSNLYCKLDSHNPSGSYKDRASQLIAAQALYFGEHTVAVSSTGNAGSAMACASAAYGLQTILFVPETAPKNKLLQSVLYGAQVLPIQGTYDEAFALSIAFSEQFGGINRNTAYNPMTVEGKKSCAVELYRQFKGKAPDIVYIPVGDGVIYSGIYKGFRDLRDAGLIDSLPRLVCVQAAGSCAISRAWEHGGYKNISRAETIADSISVASPAGGRYALKGLAESRGWCTVISDEQILEAQLELARRAGIFAEPAAAAAWAGFVQDSPKLDPHAVITVLITGSGFKDMDVFDRRISIPEPVAPSLEECMKRIKRR